MKKYFIPLWRITVLTIAITLFVHWFPAANTWTNSVPVGRVLIPKEYFDQLGSAQASSDKTIIKETTKTLTYNKGEKL